MVRLAARRIWPILFLSFVLAPSALAQLTFQRAAQLAMDHASTDSAESLCNADLDISYSGLVQPQLYSGFNDFVNSAALVGIPAPFFDAMSAREPPL